MEFYELILTSVFTIMLHHHLILLWERRRRKGRGCGRRRWWIRPINRPRNEQGYATNILREMETQDHEEFFQNMRMWPEHFNWLLDVVRGKLEKRSKRTPLDPKLRLQVTLLYLAQGDSILSKHTEFRIGKSTVHAIIPETCQAIWEVLQPIFLPAMDENSWKKVVDGFLEKWQFPNCIGAIDGKHVRIKAPPMSGFQYYNYKGFFSIVLLAACDADYKFTWVDIGQYGSISDGGVWANTDFVQALEEETANLPPPIPLPNTNISDPFPHVFVADKAFPLSTYMMRPFPRRNVNLSDNERIFNYRLSRARRVIENTFGILGAKWQILNSTMSCSPKKAERIMLNIVMETFKQEHGGHRSITQVSGGLVEYIGANRSACIATEMRNKLMQYFVSDIGQEQAPWQYERAFRGRFINLP
ncbi:uncharacterized protein [Temnothorax nylanderi]|uniref:uncharacterized protein n=1 Tax=Temnothorax nylanderi TaxID=102681 RepID=UPI003A8ADD25